MRILALILFFIFVCLACVKKPSTSPIPSIVFKDFKAWKVNGNDTGYIVIGYSDGDGDIFRNAGHAVPNLIITTLHRDSVSGLFVGDTTLIPNPPQPEVKVAISYATAVYQPGGGYNGQSVSGDIIVPYKQFRTSSAIKIIKHIVYVVDEAGHHSNTVTSPIYTLTI